VEWRFGISMREKQMHSFVIKRDYISQLASWSACSVYFAEAENDTLSTDLEVIRLVWNQEVNVAFESSVHESLDCSPRPYILKLTIWFQCFPPILASSE
jgi:hypothetical protein